MRATIILIQLSMVLCMGLCYADEIAIYGNSRAAHAVGAAVLSNALETEVELHTVAGSNLSILYPLAHMHFENGATTRFVVYIARYDEPTDPQMYVEGQREFLRNLSVGDEIKQTVFDRISTRQQAEAEGSFDRFDFYQAKNTSLLSEFLSTVVDNGAVPIIARYRGMRYVTRDPQGPFFEKSYKTELNEFVREMGGIVLDYSLDPEIQYEHFADAAEHYTDNGKTIFTRLLGTDLRDIITGNTAENDLAQADLMGIAFPEGSSLTSGTKTAFKDLRAFDSTKWSYFIPGAGFGERYLGQGDISMHVPSCPNADTLALFSYARAHKSWKRYTLLPDASGNSAPLIDLGPDSTLSERGTISLTPEVSDDQTSLSQLAYRWTVEHGDYYIEDPESFQTRAVPTDQSGRGMLMVKLVVSDGLYESFDMRKLYFVDTAKIRVLYPDEETIWPPGERRTIRWESAAFTSVIVEITWDGGLQWRKVSERAITRDDERWANLPWRLPLEAPTTDHAVLRISDYNGGGAALSAMFSISRDSLQVMSHLDLNRTSMTMGLQRSINMLGRAMDNSMTNFVSQPTYRSAKVLRLEGKFGSGIYLVPADNGNRLLPQ